jgi:integrase/recombinase XerD
MIRDHAILMVLAVYGVRSREVARLRLDDIDWQNETKVFARAKGGGSHSFPLQECVGAVIVSYSRR